MWKLSIDTLALLLDYSVTLTLQFCKSLLSCGYIFLLFLFSKMSQNCKKTKLRVCYITKWESIHVNTKYTELSIKTEIGSRLNVNCQINHTMLLFIWDSAFFCMPCLCEEVMNLLKLFIGAYTVISRDTHMLTCNIKQILDIFVL